MGLRHCRFCEGSRLSTFLDLGFTPLADSFLREGALHRPETSYPLSVSLCADCGATQLDHVVAPEVLFQRDYPYESSITVAGRTHFGRTAQTLVERLAIPDGQLAVDIGSNVGVLLAAFERQGCRAVGVEPAPNIAAISQARGQHVINDFWSPRVARRIVSEVGLAAAITATNVFAHVDDLGSFMDGIDLLLDDRGAFVIEAPHFLKLLQGLEYDTIYHEHLSYLAIKPLAQYFSRRGYEIFELEEIGIHGGSLRIWVGKNGKHRIRPSVQQIVEAEEKGGCFDLKRLAGFADEVRTHRLLLNRLIRSLKADGKSICAVGAPAKGMTLLNYCHLGPELIDFVTEKSNLKIGRYTPGMHLPVLTDQALLERKPDYGLLLAWNFAEEIMANLSTYRERGGKFIIPIPKPTIV